jgi:hypothetical protein
VLPGHGFVSPPLSEVWEIRVPPPACGRAAVALASLTPPPVPALPSHSPPPITLMHAPSPTVTAAPSKTTDPHRGHSLPARPGRHACRFPPPRPGRRSRPGRGGAEPRTHGDGDNVAAPGTQTDEGQPPPRTPSPAPHPAGARDSATGGGCLPCPVRRHQPAAPLGGTLRESRVNTSRTSACGDACCLAGTVVCSAACVWSTSLMLR